ncbi:LysE family translocator [Suttonella ornithocola]|uniref:Leucine efflux protein n=1 Tax=Suttonella ornithocola TaxID=279832 RepID=A0A380MXG0_9GAMM|nr:LysE family translocator [Suttonella ornithocola]SUO97280.1 Leucine efflux protein [Suttonella ornithocola]
MNTVLLTYLSTVFIFLIIPGPVNIMVINAAAQRGWRGTLVVIIATNTASLVLIATAAAIIGGIANISPKLFNLLTAIGGLYLIYYGISLLKTTQQAIYSTSLPNQSLNQMFLTAFGVGISNPKDIIFFMTFFPPFIEALSLSFLPAIIILTLLWCLLDYSILFIYGIGAAKLISGKYRILINRLCALIFVLLGIYAFLSNLSTFII